MILKRYPLLRNLFLLQAAAITIGVGVFSLIYFFSIQARIEANINQEKQNLAPQLAPTEERWRAWSQLDLQEALRSDLEQFAAEHDLKALKVMPRSALPSRLPAEALVLPRPDKGPLPDSVVYAEINSENIAQQYRPDSLVYSLLVAISGLFLGLLAFSAQYLYRAFYVPLLHLLETIKMNPRAGTTPAITTSARGEMQEFINFVNGALKQNTEMQTRQATHALAAQVSHDIRSPLSALNMVAASLKDLPEQKRLVLLNATQRINDIANCLLNRTEINTAPFDEPVFLIVFLDSLLSEKRFQWRERKEVLIQGEFSEGYGLFATINPRELARALSNLINNAVEAVAGSGRITIGLHSTGENIEITITDTGKGIPEDILPRLAQKGFSYGKDSNGTSGSGLGLYHARQLVKSVGGTLAIQSRLGLGTTVSLILPKAEPPDWVVDRIALKPGNLLVSVDDDPSIHQAWAGRLRSAGTLHPVEHLTFTSLADFEEWLSCNPSEKVQILIDYEFAGQSGNGLDVIERNRIADRAYLVTSRFGELLIQRRANTLGVRLIPKNLATLVPFSTECR